jgi:hypothetical protein
MFLVLLLYRTKQMYLYAVSNFPTSTGAVGVTKIGHSAASDRNRIDSYSAIAPEMLSYVRDVTMPSKVLEKELINRMEQRYERFMGINGKCREWFFCTLEEAKEVIDDVVSNEMEIAGPTVDSSASNTPIETHTPPVVPTPSDAIIINGKKYTCKRCHYCTDNRTVINNHFKAKRKCHPLYSDVPFEQLILELDAVPYRKRKPSVHRCSNCLRVYASSASLCNHKRRCKHKKRCSVTYIPPPIDVMDDVNSLRNEVQILRDEISRLKDANN